MLSRQADYNHPAADVRDSRVHFKRLKRLQKLGLGGER